MIPHVEVWHDSIADMVNVPKDHKSNWAAADQYMAVGDTGSWFFHPTFEESKADILAGWPDGVKAMQTSLEAMRRLLPEAAAMVAERMETVWDVAGDEVDIGRYLEGEPECMGTGQTVFVPAQGRVVSLVILGGASGSVKAENMAKAAVGAMAIIDAIEAAGMRCEVNVVFAGVRAAGDGNHAVCVQWIPCKAAQDPLDMGRIASAIHPDMFRRFGLKYWIHEAIDMRGSASENLFAWGGWIPPQNAIVVDMQMVCFKEPADWVPARIAEIMTKLGIVAA